MHKRYLKEIPGFPGYYASRSGKIYSRWKTLSYGYGNGGIKVISGDYKELKLHKSLKSGYFELSLYDKGRNQKTQRVHTVILNTFVGDCPEGLCGCHNNGKKTDNRLSNLRWDTYKSNCFDKIKHRTNTVAKGESHYKHILNEDSIREIKFSKLSRKELALKFGVSERYVGRIQRGERWKHIGL